MSICVISCVWQRLERLSYTLNMMDRQTHTDFVAWFVVNNAAIAEPALSLIEQYPWTRTLIHQENRGPFARIEVMHTLKDDHDYFLYIDDDLNFGDDLLASWWARRNPNAVQGWKGHKFIDGDYWKRIAVADGEPCHYLWGSNLLVPAAAVQDYRIRLLDERYWQCDDLWLCFWANHHCGLDLMQQSVDVHIEIDGKDTYHGQHEIKQQCLDTLIAEGWKLS